MTTPEPLPSRATWLERFAPLGGIVFAIAMLVAFFTSDDYGDDAQSVIEYADSSKTEIWTLAVIALAAPLLLGWTVAGLMSWMRPASTALRTLTMLGGTLFIAFVTIGLTIWTAPLLDDSLSEGGAETYLALDDFGWVILGTGGVAAGVMIIAISLAALRHAWVPAWLGWLSLLLGVVSLASVAAIGLFAWVAWLIGAGVLMLLRGNSRDATAAR